MEVDLKITFSREEIEAMVLDKVRKIETAVPGEFKVHAGYGYIPPIVATFVPRDEQEEPVVAPVPQVEPTEPVLVEF